LAGSKKQRLDVLLVEKGFAESRHQAKAMIMAGDVLVANQPANKPGTQVSRDAAITVSKRCPYVSRGGIKLEGALKAFGLDVSGYTCMDVGASTGGFTDCLLQHGAKKVFAVDVGYGQLAWKLRQDPRVVPIERTNIRYMPKEAIPCPVDLVTIDVSFISLKIVIPSVLPHIRQDGKILALIKPQFEVGKGEVGKGGVVRDPTLRKKAVDEIAAWAKNHGLSCKEAVRSAITGPKGNVEFFNMFSLDFYENKD